MFLSELKRATLAEINVNECRETMKHVKVNTYIELESKDKKELYVKSGSVVYKNDAFFIVKNGNKAETVNFYDVLTGKVKIKIVGVQ